MEEHDRPPYNGGFRPVPDPTVLTTQLVNAAVSALREVLEARLDGYDTAIQLLQGATDRLPARMDEKVNHLRELADTKFDGIQTQFRERDTRTDQSAAAATTAVNAALQAQKEAAGTQTEQFGEATRKSEDRFTKQIDQQGELLRTATKGLEDKINDLKDRFNRGEGVGIGTADAHTSSQASTSYAAYLAFGAAGLLLGVGGIVLALVK
jgi:chromosome segregation ATPase